MIDVQGITGKLAEGSFAILNPTAYGYLDKYGNLDPHPWIVKFPDKPYDWPYGKVDLSTIPVGRASTDGMEAEGEGDLLDSITGTIAWAKTLTGSLTQTLAGKVVTAGNDQFSGCIYIEEPDGSCGIKVVPTSGSWHFGDTVNVTDGTMDDDANGERYIASATVEPAEAVATPDPVLMIHRSLGGAALGGQQGIFGAHGLNNIGLLVKAVGKITARGADYIYIDDGSALQDGSGNVGVRVKTGHLADSNDIVLTPGQDQYVVVTGISSCMLLDSHIVRLLRPRSRNDVLYRDQGSQAWPMFAHDQHHTGRAFIEDSGGAGSGTVTMYEVWTAEVPTLSNDRPRYAGEEREPIGHRGYYVDHPIFDSSPVVQMWKGSDGQERHGVFVGGFSGTYSSSTGRLYAFTIETGAQAWVYPSSGSLPGGIASTPAVARVGGEMRVFFGCMDGKVYALNAETGALCWQYDTGHKVLASPVVSFASPGYPNGVLYIGTEWNDLYALDADTGGFIFRTDLNIYAQDGVTGVTSAAVVNRNGYDWVLIGSDDGYLYKVCGVGHPTQGAIAASFTDEIYGRPIESSPSYRDGLVYFGQSCEEGGPVYALDFDSFQWVWNSQGTAEIRTTPALCDEGIYVGDETGSYLYRFTLERPLYWDYWPMNECVFSSPALARELVYAGSDYGSLRAFKLTNSGLGNKLVDENGLTFDLGGKIASSVTICYTPEGGTWRRWLLVTSRGPVRDGDGNVIRLPSQLYVFSSHE